MSNKDEATREALASELGQLKDNYSRLERAYNELRDQASQNQGQGFRQAQRQQVQHLQNIVQQEQERLQNHGQTS